MSDQGTKHDGDKVQVELLSPIWLMGVGRVLTFGAKKYAAHNWRKGIQLSRLLGAALRHILAFLGGEDLDPESKLPHLDHAACCLMFARELWETRKDLDDRFKPGPGTGGLTAPQKLAIHDIVNDPTKEPLTSYNEAEIKRREQVLDGDPQGSDA